MEFKLYTLSEANINLPSLREGLRGRVRQLAQIPSTLTPTLSSGRVSEEGFTLIELSIVLVIIGLLIGGILAAQSMISTAKINSVAMQIGQFDAGVENFKTKYNYLPGDAPSFGGDGDGSLTREIYGQTQPNVFGCEMANFWNNLDPQQFPGNTGCTEGLGVKAVTTGISQNVPLSKLGKSRAFFIASGTPATCCGAREVDPANPKNFYLIMDPTQVQSGGPYFQFNNTSSVNSPVKPADLLALDKKIDDGMANAGNVTSGSITNACPFPNIPTALPLSTCSSGVNYVVTNNSYECTPLIRIGASAGDPQ